MELTPNTKIKITLPDQPGVTKGDQESFSELTSHRIQEVGLNRIIIEETVDGFIGEETVYPLFYTSEEGIFETNLGFKMKIEIINPNKDEHNKTKH